MGTHLFGDDTAKGVRAVHLQMHLVRLVAAQIAVFRLRGIVKNKLCGIAFSNRNHIVCNHFAHVDKRNIKFSRKLLIQRRVATIAVMDLRRRIIVQTTYRTHDDRICALRADIGHHLFHVGGEKVFCTVVHVIDAELDNNVIAGLKFVSNAVAVRTALLEEHVVVANSRATFLVLAAATQRHASLAAIHDRSLVHVEPEMKILSLPLLGVVTFRPVLHGGVTAHIDGNFRHRKRCGDHRSDNGRLPNFAKHAHRKPL